MADLNWPERPTCHDDEPSVFARSEVMVWRPSSEDEYGPTPHRTCGYCGSIHPEDLLAALAAGATMNGSDWKYGWPHKHYVDVPNPEPEREWVISKGPGDEVGRGTRPSLFAKWYNAHLRDLDAEAFAAVAQALLRHTDITWRRDDDGRIKFAAPHHGYQRG